MGKIYLITSPSGKQYVGLTIQKILNDRLKGHLKSSSHCTLLKRAIEKYDWDNMKVEVLIECDDEQVEYYEKLFIAGYGTQAPLGYNCTSGGEGGKRLCEETKENIRSGLIEYHRENGTLGTVQKTENEKFKAKGSYKTVLYQLGTYDTEEEARKVINEFYQDPENWKRPDNMSRKNGSGGIKYVKKLEKYVAIGPQKDGKSGVTIGYYPLCEDAEKALENYKQTGKIDNTYVARKQGTGSISYQKNSGTFVAMSPSIKGNRKRLGTFKTYKKAEEVLDKYLADNNLV